MPTRKYELTWCDHGAKQLEVKVLGFNDFRELVEFIRKQGWSDSVQWSIVKWARGSKKV